MDSQKKLDHCVVGQAKNKDVETKKKDQNNQNYISYQKLSYIIRYSFQPKKVDGTVFKNCECFVYNQL